MKKVGRVFFSLALASSIGLAGLGFFSSTGNAEGILIDQDTEGQRGPGDMDVPTEKLPKPTPRPSPQPQKNKTPGS